MISYIMVSEFLLYIIGMYQYSPTQAIGEFLMNIFTHIGSQKQRSERIICNF